MAFKQKDFVELDYTGTVKEDNIVFDTTNEEAAKKNNIYNEHYKYGPVVICLGENQILLGLEKKLLTKDTGKCDVELEPEEAFGKKSAQLLKLIPQKAFKKDNIMPYAGLQVNIDGHMGTVRSASGGRIIVDFNHPLAGKKITYSVNIIRKIEDTLEKAKSVLAMEFYLRDAEITLEDGKVTIGVDFSPEINESIKKRLMELVTDVKDVSFKKAPEKTEATPEQ